MKNEKSISYKPVSFPNIAGNQIAIYAKEDSSVEIQVRTDGETVWLTRNQLAELFDRDVKTIGKHVANALREELAEIPVVANFATTASDGKTYQVEHYNLDMILSVGYRVKSANGIKFRRWANDVLRRYLIAGYVRNDARLKQLERSIPAEKGVYDKLHSRSPNGAQCDSPGCQPRVHACKYSSPERAA